jgi:two-component system, chemotaxis family, chemotaxis protein CheY
VQKEYVLVVEDDPDIRAIICDILTDDGYEVVGVPNGKEALDQLHAREQAELILLDLMMPVMDGATFRHRQLAEPALSSIPVMVVSACADTVDPVSANAVLDKPFAVESLLGKVHELCPAHKH